MTKYKSAKLFVPENFLTNCYNCHSVLIAMMAIFLGDNEGSKMGSINTLNELPHSCSWRSNNRSSRIRVSTTDPRAALTDQYGPISSCIHNITLRTYRNLNLSKEFSNELNTCHEIKLATLTATYHEWLVLFPYLHHIHILQRNKV